MTGKRNTPGKASTTPVDERAVHVEAVIEKILARHPRLKTARESRPATGRPSGEFVREALATFRGRFRAP
jgi:hypothetical protein